MNSPRNSLRRFRIPLLLLLVVVAACTLVSFHGGLVILSSDGYPQNRQMPQLDNITAQASIRPAADTRTIIPGLLYYYRVTPANTLDILLEAPMQRDYAVKTGGIISCELNYSDGRTAVLVEPGTSVTAESENGDSVSFAFAIPDPGTCDLTLTCKAYLESSGGKKVLSSVFKKMTYTGKREFYLRSMVNQKSSRLF